MTMVPSIGRSSITRRILPPPRGRNHDDRPVPSCGRRHRRLFNDPCSSNDRSIAAFAPGRSDFSPRQDRRPGRPGPRRLAARAQPKWSVLPNNAPRSPSPIWVGRDQAGDQMVPDGDLQGLRRISRRPCVDVRHDVAKPVDTHDHAVQRAVVHRGARQRGAVVGHRPSAGSWIPASHAAAAQSDRGPRTINHGRARIAFGRLDARRRTS